MQNKLLRLSPFIITWCIALYTIFEFLLNGGDPEAKQYIAMASIIINLVLYVKDFEVGSLFTGLILLLAGFNLLVFFHDEIATSLFFYIKINGEMVKVSTPQVSLGMISVFSLYIIINRKTLVSSIRSLYPKS